MTWNKVEKNTCKHYNADYKGLTLVVEKTPGYDPVYGVFQGTTEIHNASVWGGTVAECKNMAKNRADKFLKQQQQKGK